MRRLNVEPLLAYCLILLILFSTAYSTLLAKNHDGVRIGLAFGILALCIMQVFLTLQYVRLDRFLHAIKNNWLFLMYGLIFITILILHSNWEQMPYLVFGAVFYVGLPMLFFYHPVFFFLWIEVVFWTCGLLSLIALIGLTPIDSLLGLPLSIKTGVAGRFTGVASSAGIIEHPLTLGPLLCIGLFSGLYLMQRTGRSLSRVMCTFVIAAGLVVAQSRGAYLATIAGLTVYITWGRIHWTPLRVYLLIFAALLAPFFLMSILEHVPILNNWFRVEKGLSGREIVWALALDRFLDHPFFGWGLGSASEITAQYADVLEASGYGAAGASFHNTFLTKLVEGGIFYCFAYVFLYLITIRNVIRSKTETGRKRYLLSVSVGIVMSSFFIDISIGGIRSLSVLCAVHLGVANMAILVRGNIRRAFLVMN